MPELAIGIDAAVSGSPGLAVGNIVGTNLVNILLILGLSALLVPIAFERATLRFDLPAMTAAALLLFLLSIDGTLARLDGGILLLGGVLTRPVWCGSAVGRHPTRPRPSRTSAPELVTAVMSTLRGDRDIAIGDLIGFSSYNIGAILGLTILVAPHGLPVPADVLAADLVLLAVVAAAAVPVFLSGARITRIEGGLFVGTYIGYLTWLLLART